MEKELILIRHGETDWNLKQRFQGQRDIPLNSSGLEQAAKVGHYLADREIDTIYSSDLIRAYDTALKISNYQQGLEIKTRPGLREMNFGEWEGLTYQEIRKNYPEIIKKWYQDPISAKPPCGESITDFQGRVVDEFNKIIKESNEKNIIVVAHGGTIRIYLASILEMPIRFNWRFEINHCSINIIKFYGDEFILKELNRKTY